VVFVVALNPLMPGRVDSTHLSPTTCYDSSIQVDDRLGGEGTGKVLGIGGGEQWVVLGALGLIWALYYVGAKDLGGDKGEDSGLSL
jgi:Photosystem II reaction centre W protein (PsbW)